MRKLTSILAALAILATCNVLPAAATTVPMVVTVDGNGTVTGSGVTGTLVAHNTYSTWTLNFPALNSAGILSAFTGTCDSAHILFGDGTCKALNSSLITSTFSGTCNSTTFLNGGGGCSAPTSTQTIAGFSGTCNNSTYLTGGGTCAPVITSAKLPVNGEFVNSATFAIDPTLQFPVTAGNSYQIQCYIVFASAGGPSLQIGITTPGRSGDSQNVWSGYLAPTGSNPAAVVGIAEGVDNSATFAAVGGNTALWIVSNLNITANTSIGLGRASPSSAVQLQQGSWCTIATL